MTISPAVNLANIKKVKNSIIGNPSAKIQLARDEFLVQKLVECLNYPPDPQGSHDDIRIEAAHVIASLSYGSEEALNTLLHVNALHAILYALSHIHSPNTPPSSLRAALTRAFRALAVAIADVIGPPQWGLRQERFKFRNEATEALESIFHIDSLDIYLPLLGFPSSSSSAQPSVPSTPIQIEIAYLLAAALRNATYRRAVTEWVPPSERHTTVQTHRGWEKKSVVDGTATGGGWVVRGLVRMIRGRDSKAQEAALSALAALSKDNPNVANPLMKYIPELPSPLPTILSLSKSRVPDVQIAACLCMTHIIRAVPSSSSIASHNHNHSHNHSHSHTHSHNSSTGTHPDTETCARTVMSVVSRLVSRDSGIAIPGTTTASGADAGGGDPSREWEEDRAAGEVRRLKTRACFVLYHLVADDASLCQAAFERGCVDRLASLIQSLAIPSVTEEDLDIEEPGSVSSLREAALTALAAISLFDNDIRRFVTSGNAPSTVTLLPSILAALNHPRPGVRYAACQCVRAVSRAVAVLRTGVVDSGLGMGVWSVLKREIDAGVGGDKAGMGDRRVLGAALAAVCNLVNEFSPLRETLLDAGLLPRLVQILDLDHGEASLKISSLWAIKNLLRKTATETKREVMRCLGWEKLILLLDDADPGVQEQAFNVIRNLAENEDGIDLVFTEIGKDVLLDRVVAALGITNEDVILQAAYVLANLANGCDMHQTHIFIHPRALSALHACLTGTTKTEIQRPVVGCVAQLAQGGVSGRAAIRAAGFEATLRHICEWAGVGTVGSPGTIGGRRTVLEGDKDVVDQARVALHLLEYGDTT